MDNYSLEREVGRGTFGITYLGFDNKNRRQVAIKTIDVAKSKELGIDIQAINEEVATLADLSGGECYRYMACYYESFVGTLDGTSTMFIISEYIEGGPLTKLIKETSGNLPPSFLWPLMLQLILGLRYIHERGYAHRDIKPDNILITKDLTVKYIDFGLSCLERCRNDLCMSNCKGSPGTLLYMPPEALDGEPSHTIDQARAHDIWSLVMVFFELANGEYGFPFRIHDPDGTIMKKEKIIDSIIAAPQFRSSYPLDDGRTDAFLNSSVVPEMAERPNIFDILGQFEENVLAKVWYGFGETGGPAKVLHDHST